MADDAYYQDYAYYMCWIPEAAFRKNDATTDESNDNTDVAFRLPGRLVTAPIVYKKVNRVYRRVAGVGPDWGYIGNEGYGEGKIQLTLDMIDLSMLYFMVKGCTTTDDTPSAGKYTHVYANTTARTHPVPSFALYERVTNADTDNNFYYLYTGCVVHSFTITGGISQNTIQLVIDLRFANVVAATALTSPGEPTFGTLSNYTFDRTSITFTKATVAYAAGVHGFRITYIDGTVLDKAANEIYPGRAAHGNRDIQCGLDIAPMQIEVLQDLLTSPLAAATASDLDLTIKMYRDATNDYTQFAWEKIWSINTPDATWDLEIEGNKYLTLSPDFIIKPTAYETGAKLTITEVNALDDDRYET